MDGMVLNIHKRKLPCTNRTGVALPVGNGVTLEAVIAPRRKRQRLGWGGEGKRKCPDSQLSIGKQSNSRWLWIEEHKEAMRQC